jgi:hypothetical protein
MRQAERDAILERQGAGAAPADQLPGPPTDNKILEATDIVPQPTPTEIEPQIVRSKRFTNHWKV